MLGTIAAIGATTVVGVGALNIFSRMFAAGMHATGLAVSGRFSDAASHIGTVGADIVNETGMNVCEAAYRTVQTVAHVTIAGLSMVSKTAEAVNTDVPETAVTRLNVLVSALASEDTQNAALKEASAAKVDPFLVGNTVARIAHGGGAFEDLVTASTTKAAPALSDERIAQLRTLFARTKDEKPAAKADVPVAPNTVIVTAD